jgi:hypothetical protein
MLNFTKTPLHPLQFNISLNCTNDSIRKITEKYNLEKNKPIIKHPLSVDEDDAKPRLNFYKFLLFLSISTITIYFYKRLN